MRPFFIKRFFRTSTCPFRNNTDAVCGAFDGFLNINDNGDTCCPTECGACTFGNGCTSGSTFEPCCPWKIRRDSDTCSGSVSAPCNLVGELRPVGFELSSFEVDSGAERHEHEMKRFFHHFVNIPPTPPRTSTDPLASVPFSPIACCIDENCTTADTPAPTTATRAITTPAPVSGKLVYCQQHRRTKYRQISTKCAKC